MCRLEILFNVLAVHSGRRIRGQAELPQYPVLRVCDQPTMAVREFFSSVINGVTGAVIIPAIRSELKPPDRTGAAQDFVSRDHLCEDVSFSQRTKQYTYSAPFLSVN